MTAIRDTAHRESVDVTRSGRRSRVLMVVANPTTSSTTGWPVGFWAAELFTRLRRQGLVGSTRAEIEGRATCSR
jgi:hypothetical protein